VLTNVSGLYRYRLGDVVRVTDFENQCPVVEFLYRCVIILIIIIFFLNMFFKNPGHSGFRGTRALALYFMQV
jgi:hypothetical protein